LPGDIFATPPPPKLSPIIWMVPDHFGKGGNW
jgi:hypothetical protein